MVGSSQQVERTVRRQPRGGEAKRDVFISHSSADRATATEIHDALVSDGLKVWFDDSEIQIGVLLSRELQEALRACRVLILSWSEAAAASRWVNFEWIAAHHLHRFILPIMLDGAHLPQCFEQTVRINLALDREAALRGLSKAVRAAKAGANPLPPPIRSESPELAKTIREIANGQKAVTDALGLNDLGKAAKAQAALDAAMPPALTQWPLDPMIVKLDGYHIKNDYMVRHWQAVQSGRGPDDPALEKADRRFIEALWLDPTDPEGLDGMGSVLFLRRDLYAAEFFFKHAIQQAKRRGFRYQAAEQNLAMSRRFLQPYTAARRPGKGRSGSTTG